VPAEDGHDHGVAGGHHEPGAGPVRQGGAGRAQQQGQPDQEQALGEQGQGGRRGVGHLVAGQTDHQHRVDRGAEHQQHGAGQPTQRERRGEPASASGQRAVRVAEPQLVHRKPDEHQVGVADQRHTGAQRDRVHRGGGHRERTGHPPQSEAQVQPHHGRRGQHDQQVHAEEPQRHGDPVQADGELTGGQSGNVQRAGQPGPDRQHGHHRRQQPGHPSPDEVTGRWPVAQRSSVGEAADEEEQRHHLPHPGGQHDRQRGAHRAGAVQGEQRDHPVPEGDHGDREQPEQVRVAIPVDRGCGGEGLCGVRCDGEVVGHASQIPG